MRILHITTEFPPVIFGGLGTAVGGLVHALADAGTDVGVLLVGGILLKSEGNSSYYGGYSHSAENNLSLTSTTTNNNITFFQINAHESVNEAIDLIKAWAPDVLHLHTAWVWPVVEYIREKLSIPMVYTVHSVDVAEYEIGHEPAHILAHTTDQDLAIAQADSVICISRNEAELVNHYFPNAKSKISIIGNGIENIEYKRAPERYFSNPVTILYSGRLVLRKGITDLMEAIPVVLNRFPETKFVFAGGPPYCSGEQMKAEWLLPSCYPYSDQIHFTGWLKVEELSKWYHKADIQLMPSRYEPFGMVLLEGMLYGLPIIAADVGGPKDIMHHYRNGLLFPPRDVNKLAQLMLELIENSFLRFKIGTAAFKDVRENWLWKQMTRKFCNVYHELLTV